MAAILLALRIAPGDTEATGIARARDGDTLELAGITIRLSGIDAPEWDQTCQDAEGAEWPCGQVARDRLAERLAAGRIVCRGREHDRYGRLLAVCTAGGTDIAAALVAAGYAVDAGGYAEQQAGARRAGRGIWQGAFTDPAEWRRTHGFEREAGLLNWILGIIAS